MVEAMLKRRLAFLRWPADLLRERVAATRSEQLIHDRAAQTRYPTRAIRYWWAHCALLDAVRKQEGELRVADVGCSKAIFKLYVGDIPNTRWVGLDRTIDHDLLARAGYAEVHECDFDRTLPLPDCSVDVAVFNHVVEHLPRPAFTMKELSRILRPGGVCLAGSPVAPRWVGKVWEKKLQAKMKSGRTKPGGHINAMDCRRWRALARESNLHIEMLTGTFLARWSGNPLENYAWWLRLNQAWGALFPSLGGEVYLAARKLEQGSESLTEPSR